MTRETYKALIDSCPKDVPLNEWLEKESKRINLIKSRRNFMSVGLEKAKDEFEKTLKTIEQGLKELKKECKHEERHYHGDPSGGRDSYYECAFCGAIL